MLRRIFRSKRDEVTGEWRRLHKVKVYALYFSPKIIRLMKSRKLGSARHVTRRVDKRGACRVLVGKPE